MRRTGDESRSIDRRVFLSRGSQTFGALALATGVSRVEASPARNGSSGPHARSRRARRPHLEVEYLQGSEQLASFESIAVDDQEAIEELLATRQRAARLREGDRELAKDGVRVLVHGLVAPAAPDASLDVHAWAGPDASLPFLAWSLAKGPAGGASAPNRIDLPTDANGGVILSVSDGVLDQNPTGEPIAPDDPAHPARRLRVRFTSGAERGVPKLRRGLYLISWRESAWSARGETLSLLVSFERDPGEEAGTAALLADAQASRTSEEA